MTGEPDGGNRPVGPEGGVERKTPSLPVSEKAAGSGWKKSSKKPLTGLATHRSFVKVIGWKTGTISPEVAPPKAGEGRGNGVLSFRTVRMPE